jgi:hypothetical protein
MANGAVYLNDDKSTVSTIHNTKLDALDELVDELAGQQLLIAYEFNHDIDRLRAHFGDRLAYIGKGVGEKETVEIQERWNRGEIQLLACHPASAGHGLNLQYSSCAHICWLSPIWDLELYDQFRKRVWRQGNEALRVINHILMARDTIDELALQALRDKDTTQGRLLRSLNNEILRDGDAHATGETAASETRKTDMTVAKLSRQADAADAPRRVMPKGWGNAAAAAAPAEPAQPQADAVKPMPKGWGRVAPVQTDIEDHAPTGQRERIAAKLQGASTLQPETEEEEIPASVKARQMFSAGIQRQMETVGGAAEEAPFDTSTDASTEAAQQEAAPKRVRTPRKAADDEERKAPLGHPKGVSAAEIGDATAIDYDLLGRSVAKHLLGALAAAL